MPESFIIGNHSLSLSLTEILNEIVSIFELQCSLVAEYESYGERHVLSIIKASSDLYERMQMKLRRSNTNTQILFPRSIFA